jgi:hypothetical protein
VPRLAQRRIPTSLSCTGGQPWGADSNSRNGLYRSARGSERLPFFSGLTMRHDYPQPSDNSQPKPPMWLSWRLWRWVGLAVGTVSAGVTLWRWWKRD